jgi:hypothetical protein
MPAKFVLFAQGRTGSKLLGDLLRTHPEVFFGDEILAAPVRSTRLTTDLLRWRHARHVVGFHVKIYQLTAEQGVSNPGVWLTSMHDRGWKVVTLRRTNLLRHVLSNMTADASGQFHDESGSVPPVRLHVEPEHLVSWIEKRQQVGRDEDAALAGVPHLALSYERDLQDASVWDATCARVFAELGLSPATVATKYRRTNSGQLADIVSNLDEIKSALNGTEYAHFLDDPSP